MKKNLNIIFRSIDIFQSPFYFNIKGRPQISSLLGGFLSLAIFGFLMAFLSKSDVFTHSNPSTIDQSISLATPSRLNLNSENFGMIAAVTDLPGNVYNDPTIFSLSIIQKSINISTGQFISFDNIELHPCVQEDFEWDSSIFDTLHLGDWSCPSNKTFIIDGGWNNIYITYLSITVQLCDNLTMNNTCKTYEEMNEYLADKYINFYMRESTHNLLDYLNPIKWTYKVYFWTIGANVRKTFSINVKEVQIDTDDGILFQSIHSDFGSQIDSISLDFDLTYNQYIGQINFFSSYQIQHSQRIYEKIQIVIASLGGMLGLFIQVGFLITHIQQKLNIIQILMNGLYSFSVKKKNKKNNIYEKKNKYIEKMVSSKTEEKEIRIEKPNLLTNQNQDPSINIELPNLNKKFEIFKLPPKKLNEDSMTSEEFHSDHDISTEKRGNKIENKNDFSFSKYNRKDSILSSQNQDIFRDKTGNNHISKIKRKISFLFSRGRTTKNAKFQNNEKKIIELEKKINEKSEFRFSMIEYLIYFIKKLLKRKLSYKEELFETIEKTYKKEVDIVSILRRIHEINKLKLLIFDERQLKLFNLLCKPMISIEQKNDKSKIDQSFVSPIMSASMKMNRLINPKNDESDILNYYKETVAKMNVNNIDKKLIEFIDKKADGLSII